MGNYPSVKVKFKADVLIEEMGEEAVILNSKSEHYYGLDAVGLKFWQLLTKYSNTQDAINEFITEYDVAEDIAHKDLTKFVVDLEKVGILEICHA